MLLTTLVFLFLLINFCLNQDLLSKFVQNDYKMKDYRTELVRYDPTILKYITLATFKYNRTTAAINSSFSFLIDVEDKMEVVIQGYKFLSNEYRHFPLRFQVNYRKLFDSNAVGMKSMKNCGNIETLYFVKDVNYYFCNFVPDENKFPPYVPTGQYKASQRYMYNDREVYLQNSYAEIYRPLAIPTN